jgi:hypothetical protein
LGVDPFADNPATLAVIEKFLLDVVFRGFNAFTTVGIAGFFDSYQIYLLTVMREYPRQLYHDIFALGLAYLNLISKSLLPIALSQHNLFDPCFARCRNALVFYDG